MGAVDHLVRLARVYVPPHVRVIGGKTVHVEGYTRTVAPGFRGSVLAGGNQVPGEGGRGPVRTIEVTANEDRMGRPHYSGPVLTWTQDDGEVLNRGQAYQWEMAGARYTGLFSGIHGGGTSADTDRALFRDVDIEFKHGGVTEAAEVYAPRSGVRSLEDIDREVREAAARADMSPIEYLRHQVAIGKREF